MNVNIDLSNEIETALRRRAVESGQDVATYIKQIVTAQLAEDERESTASANSHEVFRKRLREIIDLHPRSNGQVDDSRESIDAGRGE